MPAPLDLVAESKAKLDDARKRHADALASADEQKKAVLAKAAEDSDLRARLLDVNSDEFKAIDAAYKPVSTIAEEVQEAEQAWQAHTQMAGTAAAAASGIAAGIIGDREALAHVAQQTGLPMSLVERAAVAVSEAPEYKALKESGVFNGTGKIGRELLASNIMERRDFKALLTGTSATSGGAFVLPDRQGGMVPLPVRELSLLSLINVGQTDSDTVEYVRQTARPTGADMVPEATATDDDDALKPESSAAFQIVTTTVKTVAHWIPATRRALADAGQLQTLLEGQMEYGVLEKIEAQIVAGGGTGEEFTGLATVSGTGSYARDTGSGESRLDAIHKGITLVRLQNIDPTSIGLYPTDWQDIRLEKNGSGDYMLGPANIPGPTTLFGLPVHTSVAYTEGTGWVGNYRLGASLWVREAPSVYMADQHADFFIRNILVMLVEARAAFGVTQPKAFAKVTSL